MYIRSTCVTCVELCYFTPEVLREMEEETIPLYSSCANFISIF